MSSSFEELGKAFVQHYYTQLATNREALQGLYADNSMMTFEGAPFSGKQNIATKIMGLTFKTIQHQITCCDCQPVIFPPPVPGQPNEEAVFVMVMGKLKTDEDPPHSFSQTFLLKKSDTSIYIANEVFRMILHD